MKKAKRSGGRRKLLLAVTVIFAILGSALSVYHLSVTASTLNDSSSIAMLAGTMGGFYLLYNYLIMILPINFCYLIALLCDSFAAHLLGRGWSISALCSLGYTLVAGVLIGFSAGSGLAFVSTLLALGAAVSAIPTVFLVLALTSAGQKTKTEHRPKKTKQ